jgi:hypothetical protein
MTELTRRQTAMPPPDNAMVLRPIETMPPRLKNGRGLMLYGIHVADSGREGSYVAGDHWWAIAVWDIWRPKTHAPRWVFAVNGEPLDWGEPTHFTELKPPASGDGA